MGAPSSSSVLSKGFVALLLLVVFLAIAIVLPRLLRVSIGGGVQVRAGRLDVKHEWLNERSLKLIVANNYSEPARLHKLKCGSLEHSFGELEVRPSATLVVVIEDLAINRTCLARVLYRVGQRELYKLLVIEPASGYDLLNRSSRSTLPRGW